MKNEIKIIIFFSFLVFNYSVIFSIGPSDSLKKLYDMDDPRNPDCPCHKYQKLAEKEYEKLLKKEEVIEHVDKKETTNENKGKIKPARFKRRSLRGGNTKAHKLKGKNLHKVNLFRIFKKDIVRCHIT